jgi:hypothetical protein
LLHGDDRSKGIKPNANDADFQELRDNRDRTMKKYATWDPGELLPYRFEMERHVGDGGQFGCGDRRAVRFHMNWRI